jgi:hypothetical protein
VGHTGEPTPGRTGGRYAMVSALLRVSVEPIVHSVSESIAQHSKLATQDRALETGVSVVVYRATLAQLVEHLTENPFQGPHQSS